MDFSPPGSSVHGIFQARILEWVAISSSRGASWPRDQTYISHIAGWFFVIWANNNDSKSETCSVSDSLWARGIIFQARILDWVAFLFSRGSFQPRDRTQVSCIAGGFFTSWATRKPKNTGVGNLSLLQWIFPTQESIWDLLRCRRILTTQATAVLTFVNQLTAYEWICFCNVYSTLLLYCLYLNQICGIFISVVLKWILKSDSENPLALFFWIVFAILGLKYINVLSSLLVSTQKKSWVYDWNYIESIDWCGDNWYIYDTLVF